MAIELLDEAPKIERAGGPRQPSPEVQEFLDTLRENPGKWAEFPGNRKTKPQLSDEFQVVGRNGRWYASKQDASETEQF